MAPPSSLSAVSKEGIVSKEASADGVILGVDTRATEGPIVSDNNYEQIHLRCIPSYEEIQQKASSLRKFAPTTGGAKKPHVPEPLLFVIIRYQKSEKPYCHITTAEFEKLIRRINQGD
ncbi:hypothetical protein YC2023_090279 [Brassica napus]